jgi:hypothetical protein
LDRIPAMAWAMPDLVVAPNSWKVRSTVESDGADGADGADGNLVLEAAAGLSLIVPRPCASLRFDALDSGH